MFHEIVPLITSAFWPATVLILAFTFRRGIRSLLPSLREARLGSNVLIFGEAETDVSVSLSPAPEPEVAAKQLGAPAGAKWNNAANVFWLGNDLDWTAQTALKCAPQERILHGLAQVWHHLNEIGLEDSAPTKEIIKLRAGVSILPEVALGREWRNEFAEKIYVIIQDISNLAKQQQGETGQDVDGVWST